MLQHRKPSFVTQFELGYSQAQLLAVLPGLPLPAEGTVEQGVKEVIGIANGGGAAGKEHVL